MVVKETHRERRGRERGGAAKVRGVVRRREVRRRRKQLGARERWEGARKRRRLILAKRFVTYSTAFLK